MAPSVAPRRCSQGFGGHARNRTGVRGFAVRCVTTPPRGQSGRAVPKPARNAPCIIRDRGLESVPIVGKSANLPPGAVRPRRNSPCARLRCLEQSAGSREETMVDAATQRLNIVESQVLTSDVTDRRILRAMRELPRKGFVPAPMAALAYMDEAVALRRPDREAAGCWPRVCRPSYCSSRQSREGDRVLDIGCGSGYSSAVLAGMAEIRGGARERHQVGGAGAHEPCGRAASTTPTWCVGELTAGWAARPPSMPSSSKAPCRRCPIFVGSVEGRRVSCRHGQPGWLGQSYDLAPPGAVS